MKYRGVRYGIAVAMPTRTIYVVSESPETNPPMQFHLTGFTKYASCSGCCSFRASNSFCSVKVCKLLWMLFVPGILLFLQHQSNTTFPGKTVRRQLQFQTVKKGMGRMQDIPPEIEASLVDHIFLTESRGFGLSISEVETVTYKLALKEGLQVRFSHEKGKAGKTWFYTFKKRHPNLSVRKPEALSLVRARGMNEADVTNIFEMFENLLNENNLFGVPARIHNADETGLQINNRPEKTLSMKGKRNEMSVTAKERGEAVTIRTCVSATGVFLPPFVVFKGKNMKQEFRDNLPPGSVVFMTDSGYITIELFRKFHEHFVAHKPQGKKSNLLEVDGLSTHVSDPDILQFAVDNSIIMISIPPHTSHYIQPLDRSFFRPLKMHYCGVCNNWIKQNPTRSVTKLQFGMLLSQVWGKACSVENGVSEFRACGLVQFNPGAIPESAFSSCECFQMTETETRAERSHCSFQPTNAEPVPGTSGLMDCSMSRQTKRRLSFFSRDSHKFVIAAAVSHSKNTAEEVIKQMPEGYHSYITRAHKENEREERHEHCKSEEGKVQKEYKEHMFEKGHRN
ncbi:hypothetical protein PR048_011264 [Dryococelus australis]|uniref:HTH CENPB-type domain-containing protein n=1 Tax=Dryococelus australis TaxID=614101 RepID=A0ABQ9HME4_9NEOP|nr:hypothetical protein PR048_011264 [Dryococelus australis]